MNYSSIGPMIKTVLLTHNFNKFFIINHGFPPIFLV